MTKVELLEGYTNLERPYEVCIRTRMGGYMEFFTVERLAFEGNAKDVCESYAKDSKGHKESFKSVCVRKGSQIIHEIAL